MTIRAVLFDFGGVLYRTPDRRWMKKWQGLLRLGNDEVISSIIASQDESPYVQAIMEGRIPENEIWERMARRWRLSPILVRLAKTEFDEPAPVKSGSSRISSQFAAKIPDGYLKQRGKRGTRHVYFYFWLRPPGR